MTVNIYSHFKTSLIVQTNFLLSLAKKCQLQFDKNCDQLTLIFPNKRASIYFADYLSMQYDQPIWSPNLMSFEEFVENQQEHSYADDLQMIFELYNTYKKIVKQPETFDAFFPWGEMILKDFNDIDNYLVDTKHIFKVIKSQKELDESFHYLSEEDQEIIQNFWKGFLPEPNKQQNEFIKTWSILTELYDSFNSVLKAKNLTYKGRMFREFSKGDLALKEDEHLWFAGFNALTKAEENIIKKYMDIGNTDIHWDLDDYYYSDPNQESGFFFRQYGQDRYFKASITRDLEQLIDQPKKEIEVIAAPFSHGQLMCTAQHLKALNLTKEHANNVLIVLTDESMLSGLLNVLPPELDQINVTMGWSILQSRIYLLISKLIGLQNNPRTIETGIYYHHEIMSILEFNHLLSLSHDSIKNFNQKALIENKIYHNSEELTKEFPILKDLLTPQKEVKKLVQVLTTFLKELNTALLSDIEQSSSVLIHTTLKRINHAMENNDIVLEIKSFQKLFIQLGSTIKLPLSGNPNDGVQIMGILETRNLSFDHIMIVGMNEGAWPKDSSNTSFIPYNIKKAFDLPTTEHQDAMQSYLFYRLLHSANKLWISYNNISEFNRNGELSRFIKQLEYESKINIKSSQLINPVEAENTQTITIEKTPEVSRRLDEFIINQGSSLRRLSPSALNTYIDCKLKFYFQQIAKIREPDQLVEDMDPSLFGNLLHGTMEHFYGHKTNWESTDFSSSKEQLKLAIKQAFIDQKISLSQTGHSSGRQIIASEVIEKFTEQIIKFDQKNTPFSIVKLENNFEVDFSIERAGKNETVGLRGIIDRVDLHDGITRILDYKSGRDDRKFKAFDDLIDSKSAHRNKAVFQLFYYCMLYKENHPETSIIQPGVFNSKDLFDQKFDAKIQQSEGKKKSDILNYDQYEDEFKSILKALLTEIFDPKVAFDQTDDLKKCDYCTYKQICMRA